MLIFNYIYKTLQYFLIASSALIFTDSIGQEVLVKAELDTNRALIGDQLKLKLSVDKPENIPVDFPFIRDTLTKKIEIIGSNVIDTVRTSSDRLILSQDLLIAVYDTGIFIIPPLEFAVHAEKSEDTVKTLPVYFEILPVSLDSTIRDIRANYKAPISFLELYPYILLAIAFGLLIGLLIYYIKKKRRKGQQIISDGPLELPEIIALRELEQLKEGKTWLQKSVKPYYIRLTEILRTYVERHYNIMALEQTTDEILLSLKKTLCSSADRNLLAGILNLADLVKFAKVVPDQVENATQVDLAMDFIRNTSYRESVEQKEAIVENQLVQSKTES